MHPRLSFRECQEKKLFVFRTESQLDRSLCLTATENVVESVLDLLQCETEIDYCASPNLFIDLISLLSLPGLNMNWDTVMSQVISLSIHICIHDLSTGYKLKVVFSFMLDIF